MSEQLVNLGRAKAAADEAVAKARTERLNRKVPELMGAAEVAETLGISGSNIDKQTGLPAHALRLQCGRLWRADLIREFAEQRRPRNGKNT